MTSIYAGEAPRGWLPWGLLAPILAIFFIVLPGLPVELAFPRFGLATPQGEPVGVAGLIAFLLIPFAGTALVVAAWVRLVERRPLDGIGLARPGMGLFGQGWLIGIGTVALVTAASWAFGGYRAVGIAPALHSPAAMANIVLLGLAFAVQASAEEILFRGWLFSVTTRRFSVFTGTVLTTAVFTLLHSAGDQHWMSTLVTILFSVFACVWAWRARSIWGVMGWHVGWNWLLAVGFDVPVTGLDAGVPALLVSLRPTGDVLLDGGAQGPEASIFCVIFFAVAIGYLLWRGPRTSPAA